MFARPAKRSLQRVQHHPLGPDRIDGLLQPDEQAVEVVLAAFLDLAPLDPHVVHDEFLLLGQLVEVEAE